MFQIGMLQCITYSLSYAYHANINSGIISSIYSTSIAFTIVIFYVFYNEKLSLKTFLGILSIVFGIITIALAKNKEARHISRSN